MNQRILFFIFSLLLCTGIVAQVPQKFNYQAVARNSAGNPLVSTAIGLRLSITDGTSTLYSETFTPTTNSLGLFTVEVGAGTVVSGNFSGIDWLSGLRYLRVEMDASGGTNYTDMGSSPLISVPYALVAGKVANISLNDMNDVNTAGAVTNQVLQWNGSQWVPATLPGSTGDNWGTQTATTNGTLTGNGTAGLPLGIAQQGATSGQVLQWNGSAWVPATISGDNWGTQTIVTNTTLTGNGTAGLPLSLSQQGAANGQVLQWNGSTWTPASITGDNWGSQSVVTSTELSGNGTSGVPLRLSQQGATSGQVLKWNGTIWTPQSDNGITLPYTYNASYTGPILSITNSNVSGGAIQGSNSSNGPGAWGILGTITNANPGTFAAGILGINYATNSNGYGVMGQHDGTGSGVYGYSSGGRGVLGNCDGAGGIGVVGIANGSNGIGLVGTTSGSGGTGVSGSGVTGVMGVTTDANGKAIHGTSISGGFAGYFDGKSQFNFNSNAGTPNLMIQENDNTDFVRIRMNNTTANKFWEINAIGNTSSTSEFFNIWHSSAGPVFSARGDGNIGIGAANPTQRLDVSGNIKFSGALMPNNLSGNAGQILQSGGAGVAPIWVSPTAAMHNNTYLADHTTYFNVLTFDQIIPGLGPIATTTTTASKFIIHFSHGQIINANNFAGGDAQVLFKIQILDASNSVVNQGYAYKVIGNGKTESVSFTHHAFLAIPAAYSVRVTAVVISGDTDVALQGVFGSPVVSPGQLTIQVIPQ